MRPGLSGQRGLALALLATQLVACAGTPATLARKSGAESSSKPNATGPSSPPSGLGQDAASSSPARVAGATDPEQASVQRVVPVVVQADVGFLTAEGLAKGAGQGGILIANDGASFQPGSASRVLQGGGLIANDGASLRLSGLTLATRDGGALVGNDGASLIANDGASLIANDGASWRLPQAAFRLAQAPAAIARVGPVGGYQMLVVDLYDRVSYLVTGPGGKALRTNAQGRLGLPLPAGLNPRVRNVLAVAASPENPGLRQAHFLRVDGAFGELNESRTLITRYVRRHHTHSITQFFLRVSDPAKGGQVDWGSGIPEGPNLLRNRLEAMSKAFHEAGLAAMRRAGQSSLSQAQAARLAELAFDRALASLDLESIPPDFSTFETLDPKVAVGEDTPGVPFSQNALGLMEQAFSELHQRAGEKLAERGVGALKGSEVVQAAEARLGVSFPLQRPQDYLDFLVEAFLLDYSKLDRSGGGSSSFQVEQVFANVGARRASWSRLRAGAHGFAIAALLALATELKLSEVVNEAGQLDLEAVLATDLLKAVVEQGDDPSFRALGPQP